MNETTPTPSLADRISKDDDFMQKMDGLAPREEMLAFVAKFVSETPDARGYLLIATFKDKDEEEASSDDKRIVITGVNINQDDMLRATEAIHNAAVEMIINDVIA
jgi:hypothetical protein